MFDLALQDFKASNGTVTVLQSYCLLSLCYKLCPWLDGPHIPLKAEQLSCSTSAKSTTTKALSLIAVFSRGRPKRPFILTEMKRGRPDSISSDGTTVREPLFPSRDLAQCEANRQQLAPYNRNDAVPPYTGIMFEMFSKTDIEILSMEIDIRLPDVTDFSVEVYSLVGSYDQFVNDESSWEHVATTTLVPAPEGEGGIIPYQDFKSVVMPMRTKRSWYITMRGPFIEHTVYALQKTGEVHIVGEDFNILVGSGLTEYKFPVAVDRILSPQFAGVVHYKAVADCGALLTTTELQYAFLYGEEVNPILALELSQAMEQLSEEILAKNKALKQYSTEFGLVKSGDLVTTDLVPFQSK